MFVNEHFDFYRRSSFGFDWVLGVSEGYGIA